MAKRIVVPCSEAQPERRHRWRWEKIYDTLEGVWDQRCLHCGRYKLDVLEQPDERRRRLAR